MIGIVKTIKLYKKPSCFVAYVKVGCGANQLETKVRRNIITFRKKYNIGVQSRI